MPRMISRCRACCKLLRADVAHARIKSHRHERTARRCPACTRSARRRRCRPPSASCRSARTSTRCASIACASSAIPSSRSRRSTRTRRSRRSSADRGRVREARDRCSIPPRPCRQNESPHPRLRRRRQRPQARVDGVRRRRGRLAKARTTSSRTSSSSAATRTCRWSSTRRSAGRSPTGPPDDLVLDADAALPAQGASKVLGAAALAACASSPAPTAAASAARATRSTTRSSWPKLADDEPAREDRLTREEVFYCHRGRHPVLMKSKIGSRRTARSPACTSRACSTAALRLLRRRQHLLHRRAADGDLQGPELPLRRRAVRSPTSRRADPKRGHGTPQPRFAARVQLDKAPSELGLDPAEMRLQASHLQPPDSVTANWLRIGTMGLASASRRWSREAAGRSATGKLPHAARASARLLAATSSGAGLPIYWNACRTPACSSSSIAAAAGDRVLRRATDIGQGSDTVLAYVRRRGAGARSLDVRIVSSDTDLTPVDLGSYSSRVTLMMGNAAIQAAERARESCWRGAPRRARGAAGRLVFAENRVFDAEDPERGMSVRRGGAPPRRSSARSAPSVRTARRRSAAAIAAPASGRRRRTATAPRGRAGRRRGDGADRRREDLDRARHRPRHQPRSRSVRSRAASTWGSAKRSWRRWCTASKPLRRAQDPVDARVQEPDHARDARGRDLPRRGPRSERAVRREGGRPGAVAADHARRRQRGVRRRRRARGRGADHAREGCSRPQCSASAKDKRPAPWPDESYPDLEDHRRSRVRKTMAEGGDGTRRGVGRPDTKEAKS